ncbi:cilia- and flagella-associated protein 157-like [Chaetodon trifascialis]|uniref:cilia- and flagella-associated protein 157-like n=1 Tax=Chaetodon trifascialis TaxID=109706 RepID=UPI003993774D
MPKKKDKKSGDKQDKDRKTPKKDSSATPADKTASDDKEKDFYLTQIRYLNEQLERYQLKCGQLERQSKDLNSQYSALEKEKKDIVDYLKRSLLEKEDEVDELTERLESQRQAADKDRDALKLQHSQLSQELQDQIGELTAANMAFASQLAGLEEFQKQKEQLMSNMESLEKQLVGQKKDHKAAIHSVEMKALLEQKRLEKEVEGHVAAMAAEVQHLVDQKVPETTRLALQENTEVKAQFSLLSEQAQVLMGENSALRDRKSQLSVDVDILEQMLSETSRQSCIRKKVVEQLTDKCQQLLMELKDCRQELEHLRSEHTGVLAEMEALRQDQASLSEQCRKTGAEVSRLEEELQVEKKRRSRMKSIMQEAAILVRQALMEAPIEQDSEMDSVVQWKQLMHKLLVVLGRPPLTNSTESNQLNELQTSDPAAARAGALNAALSLQLELAHYKLGHLGRVPCPTLRHKLPRTGAGSSSTHMPLHRKPSSLRTAGSIKPTDSAVRFLTSRKSITQPK